MSSQAPGHIRSIVAKNIRDARDARGLTQRELAERLSVKEGLAVSRWERGKVLPSTANLTALADVLGCDVAWFYTDHELEAA